MGIEVEHEFPDNDDDYQEVKVAKVKGGAFESDDGWSLIYENENGVTPEVGQTARLYGGGFGFSVRGLFFDGRRAFYETREDHHESQKKKLYGESAEDLLARWDNEESVWTVSMGGFGPGYEQALQIMMFEMLREMIAGNYDSSNWQGEADDWKDDRDAIGDIVRPRVEKLGASGAMWGAAMYLAAQFYSFGPISVLETAAEKDRTIQVSKDFPSL